MLTEAKAKLNDNQGKKSLTLDIPIEGVRVKNYKDKKGKDRVINIVSESGNFTPLTFPLSEGYEVCLKYSCYVRETNGTRSDSPVKMTLQDLISKKS